MDNKVFAKGNATNVRLLSNTKSSVIGQITKVVHAEFISFVRNADNEQWIKVRLGKDVGYVRADVAEIVQSNVDSKTLTDDQVQLLARRYEIPYANLKAVIEVESSGGGYNSDGTLKIQFEPHWFRRLDKDWYKDKENITWQANKVSNQKKEWEAFNSASKVDLDAAIKSTSTGLMQVMGFHYKLLGFKTPKEMWDYSQQSEMNQLDLGLRFIKSNKRMHRALKNSDFATFAYYYNGSGFKKFNYDTRMLEASKRYSL